MNKKKRILVRVDGSRIIGLGHVYNMLTVLEHFQKEEILIVMKDSRKLGAKKFKKNNFRLKIFSTRNDLKKIIEKFKPDIIFNDLLNTEISYMKFLKKFNSTVINFEDLGKGKKYADLVFNPIYYSSQKFEKEFYGHRYACVRTEFRKSRKNILRKKVKKIVITFGGTDPTNKTKKIINFIKNSELKNIQWNIILGLGYSQRKEIRTVSEKMNYDGFNIKLIEKTDNISEFVNGCDFAITSNGRTVFELAAMKIPMISIAVNKRERQHSFVRKMKTGFHINYLSTKNDLEISKNVNKMFEYQNRLRFINNMKKADIYHGINRVVEEINKI